MNNKRISRPARTVEEKIRRPAEDASAEHGAAVKKPKLQQNAADIPCECPLNCPERVPPGVRDKLYRMFVAMCDETLQNDFLQNIIEAKPVADRLFSTETTSDGKLLRRVHCKYRIPLDAALENFVSSFDNRDSDDVGGHIDGKLSVIGNSNKENEEAIESNSTNALKKSLNAFNCVDVCQKAFINIFGISSSRIKVLRELLIIKVRQNHIKHMMKNEGNQLEVYVTQLHFAKNSITSQENTNGLIDQLIPAISNDIILINDFFDNQLWKPEYFK